MYKRRVLAILLLAAATSSAAFAQSGGLRGTVGQLGGTVRGTVGTVGGTLGGTVERTTSALGNTVGGPVGDALSGTGTSLGTTTRQASGGYYITGSRITHGTMTSGEGSSSSLAGFDSGDFLATTSLDDLSPVLGYLSFGAGQFVEARKLRHQALIEANRKTLDHDESGQPVLRLQPRNEKYRAQTVPSETVSGLYKAVFKYQRVDED